VPGRPVSPLAAREFARELWRGWGVLYCTDGSGAHWTALGEPEFVDALWAASERLGGDREGVRSARFGEFPLEEFRARWLVRGWPHEWRDEVRLDVVALARDQGA
jgi:hypothetical protein